MSDFTEAMFGVADTGETVIIFPRIKKPSNILKEKIKEMQYPVDMVITNKGVGITMKKQNIADVFFLDEVEEVTKTKVSTDKKPQVKILEILKTL